MKLAAPSAKLQAPSSPAGFTLLELLLYVSISAVLLLSTVEFLDALLRSRVKNMVIAEVEQQGAQVLQQVTQAVRNSEAITTPAP